MPETFIRIHSRVHLKLRGGAPGEDPNSYYRYDFTNLMMSGDSDHSQPDVESPLPDYNKEGLGYVRPHGYNFPPFDDGTSLRLPEGALGSDNMTEGEALDLCKVMNLSPDKLGQVDARDVLDAVQGRSRIVKEYYRQRLVRKPNGRLIPLATLYADIFRKLDEVHNLQVLRHPTLEDVPPVP
jgi:hypothetical protein